MARRVGAGADLCRFEGEVVRKSELGGIGGSALCYVLMVEPGLFLRAVAGGEMSPAWFANHTCVNANARIVVVGGGSEVSAVLRATRDIVAGEEVLVNYRLSGVDGGKLLQKYWQFKCVCVHCSSQ
jgi:hypothetical protein